MNVIIMALYMQITVYQNNFHGGYTKFDALYCWGIYFHLLGMKDTASGWSQKIHASIVIIQITAGGKGRSFIEFV